MASSSLPLACVVLAAGKGTRMKSATPKILHAVGGVPMIRHVLSVCSELAPSKIVVVVGPDMKTVEDAVVPHPTALQREQKGTADAVKAAHAKLKDFIGDILVLFGDTPLITTETLEKIVAERAATKAAVIVAAFRTIEPGSYGRLDLDLHGNLDAIVEASEATPDQLQNTLCNGGIMLLAGEHVWPLLDKIEAKNSKKEFYLTDIVGLARQAKLSVSYVEVPHEDVLGVNTRAELAGADAILQNRLRERFMQEGVTLIAPETVYLSADTILGQDVTIGPHVVIGPGVIIADHVTIKPYCHLEQVTIEQAAQIGPFARIRPGSQIGMGAHIGNFVEIKNTEIGQGAKVNHLTYLGDAIVGAKANIGAGTITCNYDGFKKHRTEIGNAVFIGSNTALVAPVKIGDGAFVGAGSVITMDVPNDTLAIARNRQTNMEDWARRYREKQKYDEKNK
jgi:bifunctional UDP-N-acetylglucosamine pyrophosphorylase / glucosamine-1-phosphate N-acetyltransferase